MRKFGASIRIFLPDGIVTGIKIAELVNKTIQAISCPRRRVSELSKMEESNKPGVYLLFGEDENTGNPSVYIGETENIYQRLQNHVSTREWNEAIFFVSKDENLTKAHIRYLESRLVEIARDTGRYKVENNTEPQPSPLPRSDRSAMEEFLSYIKMLIGVLGHKLLEEVTIVATAQASTKNKQDESEQPLELFLSYKREVQAQALQTDEGIVVLKGSEAIKDTKASLPVGYNKLREQLIENGILKLENNKYIFQHDFLFNTASPAAAVITATNVSGPQYWKDSSGKMLKDIEQDRMERSNRLF